MDKPTDHGGWTLTYVRLSTWMAGLTKRRGLLLHEAIGLVLSRGLDDFKERNQAIQLTSPRYTMLSTLAITSMKANKNGYPCYSDKWAAQDVRIVGYNVGA